MNDAKIKKIGLTLLKYGILVPPTLVVVGIYGIIMGMPNDEFFAVLVPSIVSVWASFAYVEGLQL